MRDNDENESYAFKVGLIAGLAIGIFVGVILEREIRGKPCEKTAHYIEQKVTSHAR